jgi:hemerythrin
MVHASPIPTSTLGNPLLTRQLRPMHEDDLLIWSEMISVGLDTIDAEHQDLFDAINDLHLAVIGHEDRESVGSLLSRVAESTHAHFASEEALMESVKYNGKALHALKHQHLLDQLDAFVARFNRGTDLNEHSLNFIRDWAIPHILESDVNFGHWYREHCLS